MPIKRDAQESEMQRLEAGLAADLANLGELRKQLQHDQEKLDGLTSKMAGVSAAIRQIEAKIKGLEEKLALLKQDELSG